jgi:hypothetical protein
MTLKLDQFDVMEYLWDTLDKAEDGLHIRYTSSDIEQLWLMGFVDTAQHSLEAWKAAFEPHRQPDGDFLISRDAFLALDRFRYRGEIRIPFDPMLINEGMYTDEGLDDLVNASIAPSCRLPREKLQEFFETLKRDFREPNRLILIARPAKERIKTLLDANPSPLRNLELLLDQMLATRGAEIGEEIDRAEIDAATMKAAMQTSSFSAQPATQTEAKAKGLQALQKSLKRPAAAEVEGTPKTELKRIRRSRKGMRG